VLPSRSTVSRTLFLVSVCLLDTDDTADKGGAR